MTTKKWFSAFCPLSLALKSISRHDLAIISARTTTAELKIKSGIVGFRVDVLPLHRGYTIVFQSSLWDNISLKKKDKNKVHNSKSTTTWNRWLSHASNIRYLIGFNDFWNLVVPSNVNFFFGKKSFSTHHTIGKRLLYGCKMIRKQQIIFDSPYLCVFISLFRHNKAKCINII